MSLSLEFGDGSSTGNNSVFGAPRDWVRSKNGIGVKAIYNRGRPKEAVEHFFFSVVWQIRVERQAQGRREWARVIHLQVESPRHPAAPKAKGKGNSVLNDLKRQVVKALLKSEIGTLLRKRGYRYDDTRGRKISDDDEQIKGCITITPLKVWLDDRQVKSTPEKTIEAIHEAVGSSVDAVLKDFAKDLDECFGQKVEAHPRRVTIIRRQTGQENLTIPDIALEHGSQKTRYDTIAKAGRALRAGTDTEALFEQCCLEIESAYYRLGHTLGWRFLTCPRSNLVEHPKVALITSNPAGRRDYPELPRRSQEDGSAYIIEKWSDRYPRGGDPLQRQVRMFFGALASRIGASSGDMLLNESLTGHFIPFRSPGLEDLPNKRASLDFSESLWEKILEFIHPKVFVVIDKDAFKHISRLLEKALGQSPKIDPMPTGWGNYDACVQDFSPGPTLCRFPHWSTYKIFSHRESQRPVGEIIEVLSKKLL